MMPFAVLLVGAILVVVAFNNTAGNLATELEGDIPGYFKWAAAIATILGLGYIPGMRTPSRWLLGLVLLVVLLANYSQIIAGFKNFLTSTPTTGGGGNPNPTTPYATSPTSNAVPSASAIAGTGSGGQTGVAGAVNTAVNATGIGSAISKLTGVPPLTISTVPGSFANSISKMFGGN